MHRTDILTGLRYHNIALEFQKFANSQMMVQCLEKFQNVDFTFDLILKYFIILYYLLMFYLNVHYFHNLIYVYTL